MSTNWGFVCTSHDPELGSPYDGIGGSGNFGRDALTALWRDRAKYVAMDFDTADAVANDERDNRPIWFLRQHPNCTIIIENEYGERFDPATDTTVPLRQAHTVRTELLALVEHARKVTPSPRAMVYVGDLEAILHGTPPVESKKGQSDV